MQNFKDIVYKQLAIDYCLDPDELAGTGNCFHTFEALPGRRRFQQDTESFLRIAVIKNRLLFAGDPRIIDWCRQKYEKEDGGKVMGCFFTLAGVPFQMRFGRDRSNNRLVVERVISGEYKMCTSSLKFDGSKIFLLLCVDMPKQEVKVDPKKTLYAYLGVMNPIICTCDVRAAKEYDSGYKWFEIGTKEEFNYRRRQIQEAVRRCQINNRYSVGGKGRKKKCQAIERWHEKENNYVDTKLHTYSRMLVDLAVKHACGRIVLLNQTSREDKAKEDNQNGEPFVLRNWSYFGLKEKIGYKCKLVGIKLEVEK